MRTVTTEQTIYTWDDLTDEQKEKAVENYWDINVDYDWWDGTYEDAENIGLKINEFDLDRNRHVTGDFLLDPEEVAQKIIDEHGEHCATYQTASDYLEERSGLVEKYSDGTSTDIVEYENEYAFDTECDDLDGEFLKSLLEDYSIMLQREYEYLTSYEAIAETLEINEYEFDEDMNIC